MPSRHAMIALLHPGPQSSILANDQARSVISRPSSRQVGDSDPTIEYTVRDVVKRDTSFDPRLNALPHATSVVLCGASLESTTLRRARCRCVYSAQLVDTSHRQCALFSVSTSWRRASKTPTRSCVRHSRSHVRGSLGGVITSPTFISPPPRRPPPSEISPAERAPNDDLGGGERGSGVEEVRFQVRKDQRTTSSALPNSHHLPDYCRLPAERQSGVLITSCDQSTADALPTASNG